MYREGSVLQVHGCTCISIWVVVRIVVIGPNTPKSHSSACSLEVASFQKFQGAGGTGIEPATCGFGACCRSFSYVQERTRRGWKSPILTAQSAWTFTRVHRRWGQNWGQVIATAHSNLAWMSIWGEGQFHHRSKASPSRASDCPARVFLPVAQWDRLLSSQYTERGKSWRPATECIAQSSR